MTNVNTTHQQQPNTVHNKIGLTPDELEYALFARAGLTDSQITAWMESNNPQKTESCRKTILTKIQGTTKKDIASWANKNLTF